MTNSLLMPNPMVMTPKLVANPPAKLADINYEGDSGQRYKFGVYPIDTIFNALGAVYLITRRSVAFDGTATHSLIYIGQTSDLFDRFIDPERLPKFAKDKANCICVHLEENEDLRLDIETDLIRRYSTPCNG